MSDQGKVIEFLKRVPAEYRQDAIFRRYGRFRADQHRRMQERDEKRKKSELSEEEYNEL